MVIINLLNEAGLYVRQVESLSNDDITLNAGFHWLVTLNLKRDPGETVDNLLLALKELKITSTSTESRINNIDLRFGNKVFYK